MKKVIGVLCLLMLVPATVWSQRGIPLPPPAPPPPPSTIEQSLTGFEEVPSVSTTGGGQCQASISADETQIQWTLSYFQLEGAVTQAH